jgi:hypothetical protein
MIFGEPYVNGVDQKSLVDIESLVQLWPSLPDHIRQAIMTLATCTAP